MYRYEDIRVIHLENTQNCQASCPMCDRNQNGGAINPHIDLSELTLEEESGYDQFLFETEQ